MQNGDVDDDVAAIYYTENFHTFPQKFQCF